MGDVDPVRFMLRAELKFESETVISCGFDLTESSIFVVTETHPPVGAEVTLRLSFPTLLEPVELAARVVEHRPSGNPGELAGIVVTFEEPSREAAASIAAQIAALSTSNRESPVGVVATYRVLLVEDNWFIRDMFAYGLTRAMPPSAVAVDHAEDAERAWAKLQEAEYDLVIVDYFLPEADGASLIARVRADERLSRVPVVAISVGGRAARDATIAAGADLFLDKPLVFRDLLHTVQILARRDAGAPATGRRAILVFDDSPLVLAVTRFALTAAGFEVAIAEDLASFEKLRVTFAPDLILVDVQMPEAFGDDVASTLRGWHGVQIPILLVSSIEETELARRARQADASGYVKKDAGMSALVDRCKQLLLGTAA